MVDAKIPSLNVGFAGAIMVGILASSAYLPLAASSQGLIWYRIEKTSRPYNFIYKVCSTVD